MKNLDVFVSTAVYARPGVGAIRLLDAPPPDPISAAAAEAILNKQQELLKTGERANMQQLRVDWSASPHHREAVRRSRAVGILVTSADLRRTASELPPTKTS